MADNYGGGPMRFAGGGASAPPIDMREEYLRALRPPLQPRAAAQPGGGPGLMVPPPPMQATQQPIEQPGPPREPFFGPQGILSIPRIEQILRSLPKQTDDDYAHGARVAGVRG